jgi:hypothetical protein
MKTTKLEFVLEFGYCNGTMDVEIKSRNQFLGTFKDNNKDQLTIKTEITLPNTLTLTLSNKNYGTDTKIYDNKITENKYVQLKQFKFGGIDWDTDRLFHLCSYKTDCDKNLINTTFWDKNGTITIDLFDKDFIQFHLHYQNLFKLY